MRKGISFLWFVMFVFVSLHAQQAETAFASVRYSFTHVMDTTQRDNPLKENMILYLGKKMSNYTSYERIERMAKQKAEGFSSTGGGPATATMNGKTVDMKSVDISTVQSVTVSNGQITIVANPNLALSNSYFKDQSAATIAYITSGGGKIYSIEEKIPAIDWNITQETKEIMGLVCQKATGDCKGRSYEAWFCSQLPYSNGPWKLGGLPGLILEAADTKKEVVFTFTAFENSTGDAIPIAIPAEIIKTTAKEFKQYQDAMVRDRQATGGSGGVMLAAGASVRTINRPAGTLDVNGNAVTKPRVMNNPIEKIN